MINIAILITTIMTSFLVAIAMTWVVRIYAVRAGLIDKPTDRTSHSGAVPRGGGFAIVLVIGIVSLALLGSGGDDLIRSRAAAVLLVTISLFALIGWLDDRRLVSTPIKFTLLLIASAIVVWSGGAIQNAEIAGISIGLGVFAPFITGIWIFGLANSYNFMEGIDGLAAGQAAIGACVFGIWFTLYGASDIALFCYALMASSLGFLVWNWEPARIFMGDVGSLSLGGVFSVLAVIAYNLYDLPIGAVLLLFGVFITDTLVTFLRRAAAGKPVWNAHREHYYQRSVQTGYNHAQVTAALILTGIGLGLLATLEMLRVEPRYLWYVLGVIVLGSLQIYVIRCEQRRASQ